jgi:hypothetical protein
MGDCVGFFGKDRIRISKLPWRALNREEPGRAEIDPNLWTGGVARWSIQRGLPLHSDPRRSGTLMPDAATDRAAKDLWTGPRWRLRTGAD